MATERCAPSPHAAVLTAAHAIGRLDGAVASSRLAPVWQERAAIAGLADCLNLAGVTITAAEFFRLLVGLQPAGIDTTIDRALLIAATRAALPRLGAAPTSQLLVSALARRLGLAGPADWPLGGVDHAAIAAALMLHQADVGTALSELASRVDAARHATAMPAWTPAVLCMIAAALPGALCAAGVSARPLPCLTGIRRSHALYDGPSADLGVEVLLRLGAQATTGLALLRRLEACAAAWHARLDGRTTRSRTGAAAALFLVWPALTRGQVAAALGMTPPGAGLILKMLAACDIITVHRIGNTQIFVAPESLADFKLSPRQGRHRSPPALPANLSNLADDVDAALAAFDRFGLELPATPRDEDADPPQAYRDQPSGAGFG